MSCSTKLESNGEITMKTFSLLLLTLLISGCTPAAPTSVRYAWVTGLKPGKAVYYRELHAKPWPAVVARLQASHIRNYSIYLREIDGKLYLFSYLEYTGSDFAADMKRMATDPETQRWWRETDPCQLPLPEAAAQGKIWSDATEVFHMD